MLHIALTMLFLSVSAQAGDPASVSIDTTLAEYNRLSHELEKLAQRNAWSGVERTYLELMSLGLPASHADHVSGAHAARSLGDITSARARLTMANEVSEDKEVIDWLWQIDQNYGSVFVAADRNKKIALAIESMPFEPERRQAVEFAQQRVEETGMFNGLLPQGNYTFGPYELKVVPRVQSVQIDMRTQSHDETRGRRKNHKRGDRNGDH